MNSDQSPHVFNGTFILWYKKKFINFTKNEEKQLTFELTSVVDAVFEDMFDEKDFLSLFDVELNSPELPYADVW
jgi:hypothetical protein